MATWTKVSLQSWTETELTAFKEFLDMVELYLKADGIERESMWKHIMLLLGQEGMTSLRAIGLKQADRRNPLMVWDKFASSIHSYNIFGLYIEEVYSMLHQ